MAAVAADAAVAEVADSAGVAAADDASNQSQGKFLRRNKRSAVPTVLVSVCRRASSDTVVCGRCAAGSARPGGPCPTALRR